MVYIICLLILWVHLLYLGAEEKERKTLNDLHTKPWPSSRNSTANSERGRSPELLLLVLRMWSLPYLRKQTLFHAVLLSLLYDLTIAFLCFFCFPFFAYLIWKKIWFRLKCLLASMISQTVALKDISTFFFFFCYTLCFAGEHKCTQPHMVCWKLRDERGKHGVQGFHEGIFLLNVMYSKVLSACESQTHCVIQIPINPVL